MTTFPTTLDLDLLYPSGDGKPMAENTEQYRWIVIIKENLEILFANEPNVFIAADLLWYPIQSQLIAPTAPDTMVVFGRPKGRRGSYRQWQEDNLPPQVVFEILSPSNNDAEMQRKLEFYDTYGVEEYYLYDPDNNNLEGWLRQENALRSVQNMLGWVSPRLGIRFELEASELALYRPDGQKFLSSIELDRRLREERLRAEQQRLQAEQQRLRAEQAEAALEQERLKAERLAEYLRNRGIDPDRLI
jgi:Uma2 family endonuclease